MGTFISILGGLLVGVVILVLLRLIVFKPNTEGDLSYTEEVKLRVMLVKAQHIFIDLTSLNDPLGEMSEMNIISSKTTEDIRKWLEVYDNTRKEMIR